MFDSQESSRILGSCDTLFACTWEAVAKPKQLHHANKNKAEERGWVGKVTKAGLSFCKGKSVEIFGADLQTPGEHGGKQSRNWAPFGLKSDDFNSLSTPLQGKESLDKYD